MVVCTVVKHVSREFITYCGIAENERNLIYLAELSSESFVPNLTFATTARTKRFDKHFFTHMIASVIYGLMKSES